MIAKTWLIRQARPALGDRFGRTRAREILRLAFDRWKATKQDAPREASFGGRLMVSCAQLTAELYRVLLDEGLSENEARAETAKVTGFIYRKMAKAPWLVARLTARSPIERLRSATTSFRRFPFGPPAYVMEDVDSGDDTVAFDVKRCPVAESFRSQGLSELCVESFCNLDYPLATKWGAQLKRSTTLAAGGNCCDFRWTVKERTS